MFELCRICVFNEQLDVDSSGPHFQACAAKRWVVALKNVDVCEGLRTHWRYISLLNQTSPYDEKSLSYHLNAVESMLQAPEDGGYMPHASYQGALFDYDRAVSWSEVLKNWPLLLMVDRNLALPLEQWKKCPGWLGYIGAYVGIIS